MFHFKLLKDLFPSNFNCEPKGIGSVAQSCLTWITARQASLSITNSWSLLKLLSSTPVIESMRSSNHLILCCPHLLLLSIFPSIRVFSKESVLRIRWPKYWSFSFSITPSNECADFLSDWLIGSPCSPWDSKESSPTPRSTEPDSNQLNAADP